MLLNELLHAKHAAFLATCPPLNQRPVDVPFVPWI
jgi:hypothetical protein